MAYLDESGLAALWQDIRKVSVEDDASQSKDGLMSPSDKSKLDGVEEGANAYVLPAMSEDVTGGAKVGDGLQVTDGALELLPFTEKSDGAIRGSIASISAKGRATQDGTPTPEAPIEIKVARGRNLVSEEMLNAHTGVYRSEEGVIGNNALMRLSSSILVSAGETYTLRGVSGTNSVKRVHGIDASGVWVRQIANTSATIAVNNAYVITFTVPDGVTSVELSIAIADAQTQLELGSVATPYVPYGSVGIEVQSKNLFDKGAVTLTRYINTSGGLSSWNSTFASDYIPVMPKTDYMLQFGGNPLNNALAFYDEEKTFISPVTLIPANVPTKAFTTPEGAAFVRFGCNKELLDSVQMERGTQVTEYEPYFYHTIPVPLLSKGYAASTLDGTADTLTIDGAGKWTWENRTVMFKVTTSQWKGIEELTDSRRFAINTAAIVSSGTAGGRSLSNRFVDAGSPVYNYGKVGQFYTTGSVLYFCMDKERFTTVADLNAWLADNDITFLCRRNASNYTTESGYVDLSDIPSEATVTCPELDALGVSYFVGDAVGELARQWYERVAYEREAAMSEALASAAPTETSPTATNHSVGDLITYQGALYRVTSAIASGESITIGTNVVETSIAEQLASLT